MKRAVILFASFFLFFNLIAGLQAQGCASPPSGIVAWWKGDGTAVDVVGENNGTLVNVAYTNGLVGQAFSFDPNSFPWGTYTGVQIADEPAYALTNSLTIEGWVRPRGDGYVIFFRGDHRPGLDPYALSMQANNHLDFQVTDADANTTTVETTLAYNQWTHVAATLDGSTGTMSIYTNGVQAVQTTTTVRPFGALLPDQSPGIGIGNVNDGGNNFPFVGDIDEITLYNRALSSNEIFSIYQAGSAGKCDLNDTNSLPILLNIDFGAGQAASAKTGPAAIGQSSSDFWNYYSRDDAYGNWLTFRSLPNLKLADGSVSEVGLTVANAPGCWSNGSADPMFNSYDYPFDGGNVTITVTNLPPGEYDLYAYSTDGKYEIVSGGANYGIKQTLEPTATNPPVWIEGFSYVRFTNVLVTTGQPLVLTALPLNDVAIISGLQIVAVSPANVSNAATVPAISNFIPNSGLVGSTVTISGTNFSTVAASNIVYFGAVRAKVTGVGPGGLTVTVPVGATYAPITVTVNGLTTYANAPFLPTFAGDGSGLSASSFGPRQDLATLNGPNQTVIADLDGDGKPDLIVSDDYNHSISIFRNISTSGTLDASSFAPRVDLPTSGGQYSPYGLTVADVDGDGNLDIVATEYGDNLVSVYRNECTLGDIGSNSFATRVDFPTGVAPQGVAVRDMDGDGRPDIVVANTGDGTVSILRNTGMMGSLTTDSFAAKTDIATGPSCDRVAVGDLNHDGRPDVVAVNGDGTLSVLQNVIRSPGSITAASFGPKLDLAIPAYGVHVAIVDVDGDGKPDLAVTSYLPQTLSLFKNLSDGSDLTTDSFGTRIDYALNGRGHTIAVGDLDGDGKPDLALDTELNSLLCVFQNTSTTGVLDNTSLAAPVELATGWNAWGVSVGDLDGDGRPDVVCANSYDNNLSIYRNQVPIAVPTAPFIIGQPTNQAVVANGQVELSVSAGGTEPINYQWSFNHVLIAGATNATLVLTNLHSWQSGDYSVTVSNELGSVTSSNVVLAVAAQNLLAYDYSGKEKITTAGTEFTYNYSGEMFFIPDTTNAVFVGWSAIHGKKQYWVSPIPDYLAIKISGSQNRSYTVLGRAGENIDTNGQPHLWAYLHKGQNASLLIGTKKHFSFPNTFSCDDTHIYPDAQTGDIVMREATSTYKFKPRDTQTANDTGQTVTDLVSALTESLAKRGYQMQ